MTSEKFIEKGKEEIAKELESNGIKAKVSDITLVWFSKTLKNWKAIFTDTLLELVNIYEFIYNGERDEFYLDVYGKIKNKKIKKGENKMKSIEKQVDLAISDDYIYKRDVLADVKYLIEENETLKSKIESSSDGMSEETLNLFIENYENKGFCKGLETKLKTIEKEFKKSGITKIIKYLPWAIVERIFRMQGGKIEVEIGRASCRERV